MRASESYASVQLSRSMSSGTSADARNKIIHGEHSFIDKIFSVFDEMLKVGTVPVFLEQVTLVIIMLQIFSFSLWPAFTFLQLTNSWDDVICLWIFRVTFISKVSKAKEALQISLIIFSVLVLLLVGSIGLQLVVYYHTRRFFKWALSLSRTCFDIIPILLLMPISLFLGGCLKYTIKETKTYHVVFLVVSTIYYFFLIFVSYLQSYFSATLPYIPPSLLTCWSGSTHFMLTLVPSVFLIISYIIDFFPKYFMTILIVLSMVFNIYMVIRLFHFPFSHIHMNAIFASLYIAINIPTILKLCYQYGIQIRYYVILSVSIGSVIIITLVLNYIFKKRIKNISYKLSFQALDDMGEIDTTIPYNRVDSNLVVLRDDKMRVHFHKLGLDRSAMKCETYLRVGIANRCQLFLNWSLSKFTGEFHKTPHMVSLITQMLSFFPCESRLLSTFFNIACSMDLSLAERFLMFQINNIKALRQSSANSEIAESITHLSNKSNTVIDDAKKFWITLPDDLSFFFNIQKRTKNIRDLYAEAMERWPNNVRICENYSHFLIEGAMDYKEGVKIKHRAELIEQGKNFAIDNSFRSLIRAYPEYLKKNVMSVKGDFIQESTDPDKSSSTTNSGSRGRMTDMSSGTIDGVLDHEIEESLARNLFTYYRLRLEFQNSIQTRKLKYNKHLHVSILWNLFLVTFISVFYFIFYFNKFDRRYDSIHRLISLNTIKYNFDSTLASSVFTLFKEIGQIPNDMYDQIKAIQGLPTEINLAQRDSEVARYSDGCTDNLTGSMQDIMEMAQQNLDITAYREMISDLVPAHVCKLYDMYNDTKNESLKDIYIRILTSLREMHADDNTVPVDQDSRPCEVLSNAHEQAVAFLNMGTRVLGLIHGLELEDNKLNLLMMTIVPSAYFLLAVPILYIYLFLNIKELKYIHSLLRNLNQQIREVASKSLTRSEDEDNMIKETMKSHTIKIYILYLVCALPIISALLFIFVPALCQSKNAAFKEYNYWAYYSITRSYNSLQAVVFSTLVIGMRHGFPEMAMGSDFFLYMANRFMTAVTRDNNYLLRGSNNSRGCVGISEKLDEYNIKETCIEDGFEGKDHNDYKCYSLDGAITKLYAYLNLANSAPNATIFERDGAIANAFHIVNSHIVDRVWKSTNEIYKIARLTIKDFRVHIALICISTFVIAVIITIVMWRVFDEIDISYRGCIQVLLRIPPLGLSSSQTLMNYITHKDSQKKTETMAPAKSVVYSSPDSVIFVNKNLNIDWINNATTSLFGYTPDQLLGQPLHTVLTESLNEELYKQIEMMKNGQCALTYEKSLRGLTDDEQCLPVHATLIGISDSGSSTPKAFVVIMRDETELINQRKSAEQAKAQSEKLLFQILPRDIVTRLNSGETDINFTVPSATIIFIDIVKFSNYAATLSPAQIMDHLSIIFAKFDTLVAKYNLITKIKLIGDVYMAAAGLFGTDIAPEKHASQMVNFALESLTALDEANNMFNSNLMTRIGINTNGPLIAGVLGTDKPVFDIIGDPINVASRLQSTGIPGTVQISEETYKLIVNMNYNIERRGEIELKGKGKKMAYIVRPLALSSFFNVLPEITDPGTNIQPVDE
ncbi:Adenylate and Guanylate cyclase catalytic domain containing protein [Trichomonas vaginalis G3]|uniref:Adenylate and Guanylate cyclase catalytic domain containing protein n=1 Tax=Trichomonas vaginalis (strain ATCC PRA-98 / G3) TaxID=412133 RepID=A2DJ96_TRIV3|nr:guanylate cyclase protein [Trichomonas vaginalis G3]EAY19483.1 Adenylate and Guanylate cyclase catalytic domain containing protein [Trichomonas vaginalis G3]KAI5520036.1 guanylate cyclase protein [Trichomonas vaginalis G3]|eukprot:XP_001580469.1 Adenylate and Guanylate cyclase catalytic domain containing protein [Trichomonas vaginalis G3]